LIVCAKTGFKPLRVELTVRTEADKMSPMDADKAGIRVCSKLMRRALKQVAQTGDVEPALLIADASPCMSKEELRGIGISASDEVLEFLTRWPREMLFTLRHIQEQMGEPKVPLRTMISRVADTLGQVAWESRDLTDTGAILVRDRQI